MVEFAKGTRTDTTPNRREDDLGWRHPRLDDPSDPSSKPPLMPWVGASGDSVPSAEAQARLFHRRVSTRLPEAVTGQHLAFGCITDDGSYFYCKDDRNGHPARATEWLATRLARHLGIATADCAIIEDIDEGADYFGSKHVQSVADRFGITDYLSRTHLNELGFPGAWPGEYLAMLRAYDLFIDNPDRGPDNFVLMRDGLQINLCAIDFASARIFQCTTEGFPVASERTIFVGKIHQQIHGRHVDSAVEMLNRIGAVPETVIASILNEIPDTWLDDRQRGTFNEFWSDGRKDQRLKNLHAALSG